MLCLFIVTLGIIELCQDGELIGIEVDVPPECAHLLVLLNQRGDIDIVLFHALSTVYCWR